MVVTDDEVSPLGSERGADAWEGLGVDALRARLGVPILEVYESIGSTSDAVRALAVRGAPHGTTVLAEHQFAGRGRHGRDWLDRPGAALLVSVLLRAPADGPRPRTPGGLPLLVGLSCARAIRDVTGLEVGIEWPNDLVVRDRKVGGILCEGSAGPDGLDRVVVGIGINVLGVPAGMDPGTAARAESLARLGGASGERLALAGALIPAVVALRPGESIGPEDLADLRRLDSLAGRRVRLGSGREARALRILQDGSLELEDETGRFTVNAGSVSPVAP